MFGQKSGINTFSVVCFGASVTQQTKDHVTNEVTGYVPRLMEAAHRSKLPIEVDSVAAGSSHFDGAGYALLSSVISKNPDLIVLDWHTTGLDRFDQILWRSFISEILDQGIQVLVAIFPKRSCFNSGDYRENYKQAMDYSKYIDILDFYSVPDFSPEQHLRDEVHTNESGATFYARLLFEKICQIAEIEKQTFRKHEIFDLPLYTPLVSRPKVIKYKLHCDDYIHITGFSLNLKVDQSGLKPNVIIDALVGPASPVVRISSAGVEDQFESIWDPWCYYQRQIYKQITLGLGPKNNGLINIEVASRLPDYSQCRDEEFDFEQFKSEQKFLHLREIFVVGADFAEIEISSDKS